MTQGINLLPGEIKPKGYALKLSKTLRQVATIFIIFFFIAISLFLAATTMFSIQSRNLSINEEKLKKEIQALETTEQKLILVQDRLKKIGKISESGGADEEVEILQTVITQNPQYVNVLGAKLNKDQAVIEVSTDSSSNLTKFFSQILKSNFKNIELVNFEYDDQKGYDVQIGISK